LAVFSDFLHLALFPACCNLQASNVAAGINAPLPRQDYQHHSEYH